MLRSSAQGVDPPVCRVLDVAGKMLRSSAQGVDPPVCRVLDVAATHARDSSCLFRRAICPLEGGGGGQTGWHRAYKSNICSPPDDVYFREDLVYFSRTMQNHILQLLQQHGFVVEESGC